RGHNAAPQLPIPGARDAGGSSDMERILTRRAALGLVAAGAGATVLAACGVGLPSAGQPQTTARGSKPDVPAAPGATATSGQPKSGGTLRYGLASPLNSIWPVFAGTEGTQEMYDKLMTYDMNLQPVPLL